MTLDAFLACLACLAIEVQRCGSQKAFAHAHNLSEQYLSEVLRGSRQPGQKILDAMGYERVVWYQRRDCRDVAPCGSEREDSNAC